MNTQFVKLFHENIPANAGRIIVPDDSCQKDLIESGITKKRFENDKEAISAVWLRTTGTIFDLTDGIRNIVSSPDLFDGTILAMEFKGRYNKKIDITSIYDRINMPKKRHLKLYHGNKITGLTIEGTEFWIYKLRRENNKKQKIVQSTSDAGLIEPELVTRLKALENKLKGVFDAIEASWD